MNQGKRRSSTVRVNERRHDFINYLNKMICQSREIGMRQSLNPLKKQPKIFRWMNDEMLTIQCLSNFLKNSQKEVVVVGIILPYQTLKQCCEALIEEQCDVLPLVLQGTVVQRSQIINVPILILLVEQDSTFIQNKVDLQQNLLCNLASVWITSQQFVKRRISNWQGREQLFKKNNSLLIIKHSNPILNEEINQRLQTIFWNVKTCNNDVFQRRRKASFNLLNIPNRNAYQGLQEQRFEASQFNSIMSQMLKINLKRNWRYSRGLLCYPFLYFISCWMKQEQRDIKQLIQISLNWYFKNLEEQFTNFIKNFILPSDQLKLRNSIAVYKKTVVMDVRRHLAMFENLFIVPDICSKYVQNLNRLFMQKQSDVYIRNNKLAAQFNQDLLQKIYQAQINKQFEQVFPNKKGEESQKSDRTIKDFETDFQSLLDRYNNHSIRVQSQLRTFNEFIMGKKVEYAEMLSKQLRSSKKKYVNQSEQLKDRLEIQMGVLQTLQEEIKELEEKKDRVEGQNEQIKHIIEQIRVKRVKETQSDSPSSGRKKFNQSLEMRTNRKQTKLLTKKINHPKQKKPRCCCEVM